MSITYITGVPRSGKSYFSTYQIWKMYKNDLKKENWFLQWYHFYIKPLEPKKYYESTYTNINQFNFDFHPRVKPLDFKKLLFNLTILHDLHVNQGKEDDILIIEAKKLNLYNCLLVIDEGAHHFTKPVNGVLLWWLTYHGHLHQDIHIITQHIDQIPSDYMKNGEFFYKCYPPSKSIYKSKFSLGLYSCVKFYKNCKTQDITIPFLKEVGKLYISGKEAERKPVLKKFIPVFIVLIIFLGFSINHFLSSSFVSSDTNDTSVIDSSDSESSSFSKNNFNDNSSLSNSFDEDNKTSFSFNSKSLITIECVNDFCTYKNKKLPISLVYFIIENSLLDFSNINKVLDSYRIYTLLLSDEVKLFLDKSLLSTSKNKNKPFRPTQTPKLFQRN